MTEINFLERHIEALVFCSATAITVEEIQQCLSEMFDTEVPEVDILHALQTIKAKFASDEFSFEMLETGGGYQLMSKPAYQVSVGILLKQKSKKRLSRSALETLSIVAYKQPITKPSLEQIRGVNCDYATRKLLEKGLIEIKGKSEGPGKPVLYGTTAKFLEYFGINSLSELPTPKDIVSEESQIGEDRVEEALIESDEDNGGMDGNS